MSRDVASPRTSGHRRGRWAGATAAAALAAAVLAPAVLLPLAGAAAAAPASTRQWSAAFTKPGDDAEANATAVSPDGSTVITAGNAAAPGMFPGIAKIVAYHAATGAVAWQAEYVPGAAYDSLYDTLAVSPDGARVFAAGVTYRHGVSGVSLVVVGYNAATGAKLWQVTGPEGDGTPAVAVSRDSATVFVTTAVRTTAYNAGTGAVRWTHSPGGTALTLSAGGSTLYVAGVANTALGWPDGVQALNVGTGAAQWSDAATDGYAAGSVTLSPDGTTLYTGGQIASRDFFTAAYGTAAGAQRWLVRTPGFPTDRLMGLAADSQGVIAGETQYNGHTFHYHWRTSALAQATGTAVWTRDQWGAKSSTGGLNGGSLVLSPDGAAVYLAGTSSQGNGTFCQLSGYATATGAPVWSARYQGRAQNYCAAIAVSPAGAQMFTSGNSAWRQTGHSRTVMTTAAFSTGS